MLIDILRARLGRALARAARSAFKNAKHGSGGRSRGSCDVGNRVGAKIRRPFKWRDVCNLTLQDQARTARSSIVTFTISADGEVAVVAGEMESRAYSPCR